MTGFTFLWLGQVVSMLGSAMTWFAFTIWIWKTTGNVTSLAIINFLIYLPPTLLSPIAGTFVDRWNRKLVMLLSDAGTALGTLVAMILYATGNLQIWHIYIIAALAGSLTSFQYPAFTAAVTTMLPKEQYARANGMLGLSWPLSGILAPMFAAALLGVIDMSGIMIIDLITYLVAFSTLLLIVIPRPAVSAVGLKSRGTIWQETRFGFQYIRERPELRSFAVLFMIANVFLAIGATLIAPVILIGTGNNSMALATVQSVGAVGGVTGGVVLSLWGGPRKRVHGVLLGGAGMCLLGIAWLGLSRTIIFWAIGSFFFSFFAPFVEGNNIAIWQSKVEADIQGRVISARELLVGLPYQAGVLAAGPLGDWLTVANVLFATGIIGSFAFLLGYLFPTIKQVEAPLLKTKSEL